MLLFVTQITVTLHTQMSLTLRQPWQLNLEEPYRTSKQVNLQKEIDSLHCFFFIYFMTSRGQRLSKSIPGMIRSDAGICCQTTSLNMNKLRVPWFMILLGKVS